MSDDMAIFALVGARHCGGSLSRCDRGLGIVSRLE